MTGIYQSMLQRRLYYHPNGKDLLEGQRRSAINLSVNCCSRKINIHVAYVGREDIISEHVEMLHVGFS